MKEELIQLPDQVAILDEHELLGNDGKKIVYLDQDLLQRFADKLNKRYKETGDLCPIIDGHTRDGKPSWEQPPILGYAYPPFEIKPLFKSGRKAIFCTWKVFKSAVPTLKMRPRRSVEIWPGRWDIDPIAVLGAETPDRFLGPLKLHNSTDQSYTRTIGDNMDPSMVGQISDAVMARLAESSLWKFLGELQKEFEQMKTAQPEEAPGAAAGSEPPEPPPAEMPPPEAEPEGSPPEPEAPPDEEEEEVPVKKGATAVSPSGSNSFVPEREKVKMQRQKESADIRVANLEKEVAALKADKEVAIKKARDKSREASLIQLEAEGFQIERDDELSDTEDYDDERFERYLGKLRKSARQDVTRIKGIPMSAIETPIKKQASQDERQQLSERARDYCLEHPGSHYDTVLADMSAQ